MDIAHRSAPMPSLARSHDGLITLSYVVFAAIALVVLYFTMGAPSFDEVALAAITVMP
ncbi:hypothetical protein [Bradyrhizobium sp. CCBAU 45384]|uniref:hypothetical protein n=1 Tax=Bradyrhizobium sp. CCBAU 45384 TaxID=858428 RepID=UPI0023066B99|nr:hypothetical protein [Bradyrhizobium sp. CCBAU 45384]